MVVGICILVDGYPLIFFFRDALKLAPGSTAFTAVALAAGLVLMVPFTFLRRLYRPNETMFWMAITFLMLCIAYMFLFNGVPGYPDTGKDMIYYAYALIFFFLLINIPNDIVRVFIPVIVLFTLVSNMGLIYSLITNPNWAVGQRATITLGDDDSGGNPHVFSRNAFMGLIACAIWLLRAQTPVLFKLFALFAGVVNVAILVLTQTRSAIVALILAVLFFMYFNVRPAQIRATVRGLLKPIPIAVMVLGFIGFIFLLRRYYDTYGILYGYVLNFMERNLENVYAILGLKAEGAAYSATLDASAANRSVSATFFSNVLVGHMHMLILGFGYKFLYLDVPVLEALTNQGLIGFFLFGGLNLLCLYHAVRVMSYNPNPLSVFLAYFFMLVLVQIFTNGRPYDISFWFPLALMTRFLGVEHLFPAHLSDYAEPVVDEEFTVVPKPA
jgi:hypothetical protein